VHVLYHDDVVVDGAGRRLPVASLSFAEFARYAESYLLLDDALEVFRGGPKLHLDLKFLSDPTDPHRGAHADHGHEVALVAQVIDVVGADNVLVTTLEDESVRAVRTWSRDRYPTLLVGLSLGRKASLRRPWRSLASLLDDLFPGARIRACGANLVVANKTLARLRLAGWAARAGLPLLVWTVDRPRQLRRWLRDPRVWLITTNYPRRALALRAGR
jgi:glycerophosphoryl diester phosphodiesterase